MKRYILGIDQGTTGTFVAIMNADSQIVASAYRTHQQIYPQTGWVEHAPQELWQNVRDLIQQVIVESRINANDIAGIGIANQGESVMLWDKHTGNPLYNVLVWQDSRTEPEIEVLVANAEYESEVRQRTGLKLDSYFSASKIRWLLDHVPDARSLLMDKRLACGTLDTWLIWKMTQGRSFVTDVSTASRTLLFNIHTLQWDDWLLNLFRIPQDILPTVQASTGDFGTVSHPDLPCRNVPVVASLVDQPAAMVGQGCLSAGQIKATYGTGCFVNLNTGTEVIISQHRLLTMVAWQRDGETTYGLDGGVFTAAASINWMRDHLHFISQSMDIDTLCADVKDSGGAMWIPGQIGLGAPYWSRDIRGAWIGLDLRTNQTHLIRAVLEGIAARVAQIVDAMLDDTGMSIERLQVDGGLTRSKTMMQIQADLLGYPVAVLENPEATAAGVCALAARATGIWQSDQTIQENLKIVQAYEPAISADEREAFLNKFDRAVMHLKAWHNDE
jgi:glycerol kinase